MRASGGQQGGKQQPDVIEFVPKQELSGRNGRSKNSNGKLNGYSRKSSGSEKSWRPPCEPVSAKPRRIPVESQRLIHSVPAASPAATTVSRHAAAPHHASMHNTVCRCRYSPPMVAV